MRQRSEIGFSGIDYSGKSKLNYPKDDFANRLANWGIKKLVDIFSHKVARRVEINGQANLDVLKENDTVAIFVCNHFTMGDPDAVRRAIEESGFKTETENTFFVRREFDPALEVLVRPWPTIKAVPPQESFKNYEERRNFLETNKNAQEAFVEALDRGHNVLLFPQCTRKEELEAPASMARYFEEARKLAERTGVNLVVLPMAITNIRWPRGQKLPERSIPIVSFGKSEKIQEMFQRVRSSVFKFEELSKSKQQERIMSEGVMRPIVHLVEKDQKVIFVREIGKAFVDFQPIR